MHSASDDRKKRKRGRPSPSPSPSLPLVEWADQMVGNTNAPPAKRPLIQRAIDAGRSVLGLKTRKQSDAVRRSKGKKRRASSDQLAAPVTAFPASASLVAAAPSENTGDVATTRGRAVRAAAGAPSATLEAPPQPRGKRKSTSSEQRMSDQSATAPDDAKRARQPHAASAEASRTDTSKPAPMLPHQIAAARILANSPQGPSAQVKATIPPLAPLPPPQQPLPSRSQLSASTQRLPPVPTPPASSTPSDATRGSTKRRHSRQQSDAPPTPKSTGSSRSSRSDVSPPSASTLSGRQSIAAEGQVRCDRCDGAHESVRCPHFRKTRGNHPDAQPGRSLKGLGSSCGPPLFLRNGRIYPQPPDGSCLFHSLSFGLSHCSPPVWKQPQGARSLRMHLAQWVASHSELRLADTKLASWVKWDSGLSAQAYASRMGKSGWGGGIEIAACSHAYCVNVWVYEKRRHGYERISTFDAPQQQQQPQVPLHGRTVHVLYRGGCHYDALLPEAAEIASYFAKRNQSPSRSPSKAKLQTPSSGGSSGGGCSGGSERGTGRGAKGKGRQGDGGVRRGPSPSGGRGGSSWQHRSGGKGRGGRPPWSGSRHSAHRRW